MQGQASLITFTCAMCECTCCVYCRLLVALIFAHRCTRNNGSKKKSPGSTLLSTCGLFLDLPCWDEMKRTLVMSCWCPDSPVSNALFSGLSHSLHARSRANFAPAGAKHRWWGHSLTPGWVLVWPYPSRLTKHLLAGYTLQHSKYKYPKIWLLVLVCKLNENPGINSD